MFTKGLILGVALFMGSAAPAFCDYISVDGVGLSGSCTSYYGLPLAQDGVLDNFEGYVYWSPGCKLTATVKPGTRASAVRVSLNSPSYRLFKLWAFYEDGASTYVYKDLASGVPEVFYLGLDITRNLRTSSYAFLLEPDSDYNDLCFIGDIQIAYPVDPQSTLITSSTIKGIIEDSEFEAVVTSITAVSEIADWITFRNFPGAVHSFFWGVLFALVFWGGICVMGRD